MRVRLHLEGVQPRVQRRVYGACMSRLHGATCCCGALFAYAP